MMEVVSLKNSVTERDHFSGSFEAQVTLLEYGNFECLHCGNAYPAIKELRRILGDQFRFVFRHFPTSRTHPHSVRAAEAAEAAGAQEKFWDMHDELFTHQTALEDRNLFSENKKIVVTDEVISVSGSFRRASSLAKTDRSARTERNGRLVKR